MKFSGRRKKTSSPGYLASDNNEWVHRISRLGENAELRKQMANESQATDVDTLVRLVREYERTKKQPSLAK
jgi:hypothetical protein